MYQALKKNNIEAEIHLFSEGGHGFGLRNIQDKPAGTWPSLFYNWERRLSNSQQ